MHAHPSSWHLSSLTGGITLFLIRSNLNVKIYGYSKTAVTVDEGIIKLIPYFDLHFITVSVDMVSPTVCL